MSRRLNGIHAENVRINDTAEVRNAIAGPNGAMTILHMLAAQIYPNVRAYSKDVLIHIRAYHPNWYSLDPQEWALQVMADLEHVPGLLTDPLVFITPANEPDLEAEGHPKAARPDRPNVPASVYDEAFAWALRFTEAWKKNVGGAVGTVPLAGGHDIPGMPPDAEYGLNSFNELIQACDILCVHAYYNEAKPMWAHLRPLRPPFVDGGEMGGVANQYPTKPIFVSEFGTWTHDGRNLDGLWAAYTRTYAAYEATGRCLGITPFIYDSGPEHGTNVMSPAVRRLLARLPSYRAPDWPSSAPVGPTAEEEAAKKKARAEWEAAGGPDHHFAAHWAAIRGGPVSVAEIKQALDNAEASLGQVRIMLDRLSPK